LTVVESTKEMNEYSETDKPVLRGIKNLVFLPVFADISNEIALGPLFIVVTPDA
jgi:hypothetical protein